MDNLYKVIMRNNYDLEFRFEIKCKNEGDAKVIAIEYLVDTENYTNPISIASIEKIELAKEISNNDDSVLSFELHDLITGRRLK
ncbi:MULTISPECIES: hypothetical protein [unclassified Clostridium]|uniref:hypothetical protein n=1 Tax=unclassified Clostridium TaxID=2614128 RepID=UPI0025BE7B37|nr:MULTISPECIES: hypothetical protein [unclassified Clostridium]